MMDFSQKLTSPETAKKFIFDLCKNDLASHLNDEYHTKLFMKNILSNFINE